jgi:hypothetical protein
LGIVNDVSLGMRPGLTGCKFWSFDPKSRAAEGPVSAADGGRELRNPPKAAAEGGRPVRSPGRADSKICSLGMRRTHARGAAHAS